MGAAGFFVYRNRVMDSLYAEAAGHPQFFRSSTESQAAVKKLATYRGRRSTAMLLNIALGGSVILEVRVEAMKALGERNDPKVALALADLLQPHEGLNTRQAAAEVLRGLPCKDECIATVVHYLERVWRGEPNHEDRFAWRVSSKNIVADRKKDQQVLYSTLYSVLQREKMETLGNLVKVYGIGTTGPSPFALELLSRLGLREACPFLLQSDRELEELAPEFYNAPRRELQTTIASLDCK
jgi:hypothetical protein